MVEMVGAYVLMLSDAGSREGNLNRGVRPWAGVASRSSRGRRQMVREIDGKALRTDREMASRTRTSDLGPGSLRGWMLSVGWVGRGGCERGGGGTY